MKDKMERQLTVNTAVRSLIINAPAHGQGVLGCCSDRKRGDMGVCYVLLANEDVGEDAWPLVGTETGGEEELKSEDDSSPLFNTSSPPSSELE